MELDSMKFRASWLDAVKNLPAESQSEVLFALIEYGLGREVDTELSPIASAMLTMVKPELDKEVATQISVTERNRQNGKKGGRPKKNAEETEVIQETQDNPCETQENPKETQNNPNKPKETQGYLEKETEKEKENLPPYPLLKEKEKEKEKEFYSLSGVVETSVSTPPISHTHEEPSEDSSEGCRAESINYERLKDYYNAKCGETLGYCSKMTTARKSAIKCRANEHGKKAIVEVIDKASSSKFLQGSNDKNWKANFDWLFKPTNFIKILEGNYEYNADRQTSSTGNRKESANRAIFESMQRDIESLNSNTEDIEQVGLGW